MFKGACDRWTAANQRDVNMLQLENDVIFKGG
jgi:hypothetical protein